MKIKYVTALSAILLTSACGMPSRDDDWKSNNDTRICRDSKGKRTDDARCSSRTGGHGWYYIGRGGYIPSVGGALTQDSYGSNTPRQGARYFTAPSYTPSNAISRGGFAGGSRGGMSAGG